MGYKQISCERVEEINCTPHPLSVAAAACSPRSKFAAQKGRKVVSIEVMMGLPDAKEAQGRKDKDSSDPAPQSRDFFWDSITLYIVGAILALTAIDVVSEYVRGSNVQCYQPNETDSSLLATVQNYVNELCSGHVPPLKFLPSFIAIHAVSILVLHYVWLNAYGADLDFFFRHVYKLERNRQPNTGDYPAINHTISREMEEAFGRYGRPNGMYWSYIIKVLFQFFLCVLGIFLVPWCSLSITSRM